MLLDDDATPTLSCSTCPTGGAFLTLLAALLLAAGIVWNPITAATDRAAAPFSSLQYKVKASDVPVRTEPAKKLPPPVANPGGGKKGNPKKGPAA